MQCVSRKRGARGNVQRFSRPRRTSKPGTGHLPGVVAVCWGGPDCRHQALATGLGPAETTFTCFRRCRNGGDGNVRSDRSKRAASNPGLAYAVDQVALNSAQA